MELSRTQLKPFLMRIWGPPAVGTDNEAGNTLLLDKALPDYAVPERKGSGAAREGSLQPAPLQVDEGKPHVNLKPRKKIAFPRLQIEFNSKS